MKGDCIVVQIADMSVTVAREIFLIDQKTSNLIGNRLVDLVVDVFGIWNVIAKPFNQDLLGIGCKG